MSLFSKISNKVNFKTKSIILILLIAIAIIGIIIFINRPLSVEEIRKSVVKINVYDKNENIIATGSGFIIFDKNILVTNAHVITYGSDIEVISEDNENIFVRGIIAYSQDEDIAILKLNDQNNIKPLKYSTSYKSGNKVIAIGSPLGIKNSVSDGIISNIFGEEDNNMIQHTAPISHGSSGGVLFNSKGMVIGMNTATIEDGQNINLAISMNSIKKFYNLNKKNKVKKISSVQINSDEDIKSIMLNNEAGNEIVKGIKQKTENRFNVRNKIKDLSSIPELEDIYNNKDYFSDILVIWGSDDYEEVVNKNKCGMVLGGKVEYNACLTDMVLKEETEMPEFILIKANNMTDDLYSSIKTMFENRIEFLYSVDSGDFYYSYSNSYMNAIKNASIGKSGNYAYLIISKDEAFKNNMVKLIEKIPF